MTTCHHICFLYLAHTKVEWDECTWWTLQVRKLVGATLKSFFQNKWFSCLQKVDHVTNYFKRPIYRHKQLVKSFQQNNESMFMENLKCKQQGSGTQSWIALQSHMSLFHYINILSVGRHLVILLSKMMNWLSLG